MWASTSKAISLNPSQETTETRIPCHQVVFICILSSLEEEFMMNLGMYLEGLCNNGKMFFITWERYNHRKRKGKRLAREHLEPKEYIFQYIKKTILNSLPNCLLEIPGSCIVNFMMYVCVLQFPIKKASAHLYLFKVLSRGCVISSSFNWGLPFVFCWICVVGMSVGFSDDIIFSSQKLLVCGTKI